MIATADQLAVHVENARAGGCNVIPFMIIGKDKKPAIPWKEYQTRMTTDAEARSWFSGPRAYPIYGIVCGKISNGFFVLDFEAERFYTAWREAVGPLADGLPIQRTGRGYHVSGRSTETINTTELAWTPDDTEKTGRAVAIETRAEGALAIGPGSRHPNGKYYTSIAGDFFNPPVLPPARIKLLLDAAKNLDEAPFTRQQIEAQREREARETYKKSSRASRNGSASVIDEFNKAHSIESLLEAHGYTRGIFGRLKRPGGTSDSVSVIDGQSCHHSGNDPLNNGKGKSGCGVNDAFDVYTHFEHGGNVSEAVKAAAESMGMAHPKSSRQTLNSSPVSKRSPWPVLHEDAMYGLAGDIVRAIDPHTEADPVAVLFQTLVGFGSAAGGNAHAMADACRHGLNEYTAIVGDTSKGRKGTSWANSCFLLNGADPDWVENHIVSGLSSGEGLIWAVHDPVHSRVPVKSKGRHTGEFDDVVEHEGIDDKRLLVMESELATPLKALQRDGNTLSPILRAAWDGGPLRTLTKNSPARATGAHISLIAHITRDELLRLLNTTEATNGTGNRILWVCARRSKCLPDGGQIHNVDFSDISRRLSSALANAKTAELITRDADARELWHKVYPALSEGGRGLAGSLTSRAEAHVVRLSMIYALMDESRVVKLPHLKAALALWNYCEASVYHLFGASLGDPVADELISLISLNSSGITKTEISHHFGKNLTSERLDAALDILVSSYKARFVYQKTAGRPIQRWFAVTDTANELNEVNEISPNGSGSEPDVYERVEREAIVGGEQ